MNAGPGDEATPRPSVHRVWTVFDGGAPRLDAYLAKRLAISRSRAVVLIDQGRVLLDGLGPKKSDPVVYGQVVEVEIPPPVPVQARPQAIPLNIVHEDRDLVVVDKQADLVVHPGPGHRAGTLVNALLHHVGDLSGIGGESRPGIVHRLDRYTSGLMVVAKSDRAHRELSQALRERAVERRYLTALWGRLHESPRTVDLRIGRDPRNRLRMAIVIGGRPARTHFRHLELWPGASLCEVRLESGRTHQIRVHAEAMGRPVVGDRVYGRGVANAVGGYDRRWVRRLAARARRQFLHAHRLEFVHPVTREPMVFSSALPADLEKIRTWARADARAGDG